MDKIGYLKPNNFEKTFRSSLRPNIISPTISMTAESSDEMRKTLFGEVKSSTFEITASCFCGHYRGNHYIDKFCLKCNTTVSSVFCRDLDFKGWIVVPGFLPKMIHPDIYDMLARHINIPKFATSWDGRTGLNVMDWLLDPSLPIQELYPELKHNGLTYFNENYEMIITYLLNRLENRDPDLHLYFQKYMDYTLIDKIPVLNEYLHMITHQQGTSKYQVDEPCKHILRVFSSLISLSTENQLKKKYNPKSIDKRMYKIQLEYLEYPDKLINTKLLSKTGLFRKNCISGRLHFTSRGVIVPIIDMHYGDEVYYPWELAVVNFKSMILNHLVNRHGFTPNEAIKIHSKAETDKGNKLIWDILNTIIAECPYKGWPILINRNPTIRHGAIMLMFITKIVLDNCIRVSTTAISPSNADFDGDEMNVLIIREMDMVPLLVNFHPSTLIPSKTSPVISPWIRVQDTGIICLHNALKDVPNDYDSYMAEEIEGCMIIV